MLSEKEIEAIYSHNAEKLSKYIDGVRKLKPINFSDRDPLVEIKISSLIHIQLVLAKILENHEEIEKFEKMLVNINETELKLKNAFNDVMSIMDKKENETNKKQ